MNKNHSIQWYIASVVLLLLVQCAPAFAQANTEQQHMRGKLWENIVNDGTIGSLGSWDYQVPWPLGMYPGFDHFLHPYGDEFKAENTFSNANFHNFRSGVWIVGKDVTVAAGPPDFEPYVKPYEAYISASQGGTYGSRSNLEPLTLTKNYVGSSNFNPLLPEEMTEGSWYTNMDIKVTRRSYTWSYPGYRDFIIYDYTFQHTGQMVSTTIHDTIPHADTAITNQTLKGLYFVFHSGISVSTKSQINFYCNLEAVQAGAFGWKPEAYHDKYWRFDNNELCFSTNYNGGVAPTPWGAGAYCVKPNQEWRAHFGPELMSPSAFGWLALYAAPKVAGAERLSPAPDILRIDSHENSKFGGSNLNLEYMVPGTTALSFFYKFAQTPDTVKDVPQYKRFNFYTYSYGPYTLKPGQSVRFILAEIAGVMDYNEVIAGDPDGHFPDSTVVAIRRNADNARNAVKWAKGAIANGIPLAACVPPPPPAPVTTAGNASLGLKKAVVSVSWDDIAEKTVINDGPNATHVFYNGKASLDGYRVYRSTDFQYRSENEPTTFRGAAWTQVADIPKDQFSLYWNEEEKKYKYDDTANIAFGQKYGYYVAAYRNAGASWLPPTGPAVTLPALESGDYNHSNIASAAPGPVHNFDIFVVPNPYVYNDPVRSFGIRLPYQIQFYNLPEACVIRIYSISGDLIKTLQHQPDALGGVYGSESWDQKSESGLLVAPGLYVYNVQSTTPGVGGSFTGKLMIIR